MGGAGCGIDRTFTAYSKNDQANQPTRCMIVYNSTIKVHPAIETAWLQWQQEEHIPDIMRSGQFTSYKMYRLLEQDDSEGSTYVIQFTASDLSHYQHYLDVFAPALSQKAFAKWGEGFIAFRTIMQVV